MNNLSIPGTPRTFEHTISYTKGKGHVSGEPLLTASCTCGLEKSSYLTAGEMMVRAKLSKAIAELHQQDHTVAAIVAPLGPLPTTTEEDSSDGQEDSTLGG
jgi:hypothetical protein